ncbi:hypothetical protein Pla52n_29730 [Stieleria varia]|uniref:Uncharacterized protein n=2 Tax=Stieleria varia TaxID=2528005 RepID=A0A5C6AZ25_9BACT|nr:hypothetical protein Pla52n_29730 [Stieleria varia]
MEDGSLTRYVVRVEGKLLDDAQIRDVWRQTTVDLTDIGSAKLDLPNGASEVLDRPIAKPEPRLSDAEAPKLLSQRGPRVFADIPDWVTEVVPDQRGHFWAPDVIQLGDRYLLYYSEHNYAVSA